MDEQTLQKEGQEEIMKTKKKYGEERGCSGFVDSTLHSTSYSHIFIYLCSCHFLLVANEWMVIPTRFLAFRSKVIFFAFAIFDTFRFFRSLRLPKEAHPLHGMFRLQWRNVLIIVCLRCYVIYLIDDIHMYSHMAKRYTVVALLVIIS